MTFLIMGNIDIITRLHILCEGKNWQCIVHNHPADYCNSIDFDLKKGKNLKINSCKTSTKNGKCWRCYQIKIYIINECCLL